MMIGVGTTGAHSPVSSRSHLVPSIWNIQHTTSIMVDAICPSLESSEPYRGCSSNEGMSIDQILEADNTLVCSAIPVERGHSSSTPTVGEVHLVIPYRSSSTHLLQDAFAI